MIGQTIAHYRVTAKDEPKRELPPGWKVRLDRAGNAEDVKFWFMPPGWHSTTGPSAIIYNPEHTPDVHATGLTVTPKK